MADAPTTAYGAPGQQEGGRAMILGLSFENFTLFHTVISLIGILSGLIVLYGLLAGRRFPAITALFLLTTVLTSVTGFLFPFSGIMPSHIVGGLSLVMLAAAIAGLYLFRLGGPWRWIYVVGAVASLYLNVFVGVVQGFQKLSFLQPLAPTQSEPPFIIAHTAILLIFIVLGFLAVRRFHPDGFTGAYPA
jgi:hypothetical protein